MSSQSVRNSAAELCGVSVPVVNEHLQKVFADNEPQEDAVIRDFRITAAVGKSDNTKQYNLAASI